MAKVHLLRGFNDLDLIDQYAQKFSQDPDWVYYNVPFGTLMNFVVKWHKQAEFQERFQSIWHEVNTIPQK